MNNRWDDEKSFVENVEKTSNFTFLIWYFGVIAAIAFITWLFM